MNRREALLADVNALAVRIALDVADESEVDPGVVARFRSAYEDLRSATPSAQRGGSA